MQIKKLTLALVRQNDQILLGLKKRGFGEGRWNGFGGKLEEGETIYEAGIRELQEEALIKAVSMDKKGSLTFEFLNDPVLLDIHVFLVTEFEGTPQETEEMKPQWFNIKDIPYNNMWPDDKYWLPLFLNNEQFKGHFVFKDHFEITDHTLDIIDKA